MEFRLVTEAEKKEVEWLWAYCFENYDPFFTWYFSKYYQTKNTFGAFEDDKMYSCLQLIPYNIKLRGKNLPTSYIVGLSSFPEARRGGIVKGLLQASFEEMRKRKHYINLLMPFKASFYYPYDYEICYHHIKYTLPLEDLRPIAKPYGKLVRVDNHENIPKLNTAYLAFLQDKQGYVIRSEHNWQLYLEEHFGEKGFIYLLENDDKEPEGYIFYYVKDNKVLVREMAYSNIKAQRSLFQFIYNHRSQVENLEWNAPVDDSTYFFLPDPKKGVTNFPFMTARIVDVVGALNTISYPVEIETQIVINVIDGLVHWNNGSFELIVVNGQGKISPSTKEADVTISIGALSQLLFGRLTAKELLYQEKLRGTQQYVNLLEKLFPPCVNYINEYY